jgi:hypothetical protein
VRERERDEPMLIEGENQVSWQEIAAEEMFFRSLKKVTDDANARVVLHRSTRKRVG